MLPAESRSEPVYQAENGWIDRIRGTREKLAAVCGQCKHRAVRIHTVDGHVYEGTMLGVSGCHLYLGTRDTRFFGPYAAGFILPLVLYELLVITLLI